MKNNITLVLLLSVFIFFSCKTKKDEILGQEKYYASDNFKIVENVTINKKAIVFSEDIKPKGFAVLKKWPTKEDSIVFTAKYNEVVTTNVKIVGLESGAKRVLSIIAKELDGTNANWRGEHEGFDFFRKEKAIISYEVLGFGEIHKPDTVEIEGPQLYRSGRNFALPGWSFESKNTQAEDKYDKELVEPYISPYGQEFNTSQFVQINTPNGLSAYKLESSVTNKNGFLKMGVSFLGAPKVGVNRSKYFINNSNPDSVYYNLYVYSPTPRVETRIVTILGETGRSEILETPIFLVKSSEHLRHKHDRKFIEFDMNFTGWKLFSFRYSDIAFATNKFYGGNGNKLNEPQSVSLIDFNLEADFPGHHYAYIDFPIITYGGPFDPTKLK